MYLREMGTVKLLDREGEVDIAQRIEAGEAKVFIALSKEPRLLEIFLRTNERARRERRGVRELLQTQTIELDDKGRDRVREGQRLFRTILRLDGESRELRRRLRRCKKTGKRHQELSDKIDANTAETAILVRRADFTTTTRNRLLTFFGEVERQFAIPIQTINRDKKKLLQERNKERRKFYSSRVEALRGRARGARGALRDSLRAPQGSCSPRCVAERRKPTAPSRSSSSPTSGWWFRSPRSTPTAASSSWI